jgi:hypothetical protein
LLEIQTTTIGSERIRLPITNAPKKHASRRNEHGYARSQAERI